MKYSVSPVWKLVGLGALAALAVGAFFALKSFRNYAETFGAGPANSPATVLILNPQPGSQYEQGMLVQFEVRASGPVPLIGLELWADGKLVGVQSAPDGQGLSPLAGDFDWHPAAPGTHLLFARAVDKLGLTATSTTLAIEAVAQGQLPPDQVEYVPAPPILPADLAGGGGAGAPVEPATDGSAAYHPVLPPEEPPPGDTPTQPKLWSPRVAGWLQFTFFKPKAPAAPAIPASAVEGCGPRIWITDNSTNEEGFHVYRRGPGMANFASIATLAAHVGSIFTYDDVNLYGTYFYYVSAFNAAGESPGNIETVVVDSPNCKPAFGKVLGISLVNIPAAMQVDRGYCYTSFDGQDWFRYPADPGQFLPGLPDGLGLQGLGEPFRFSEDGKPQALDLECWGWNGGGLHKLGKWHFGDLAPRPQPPGGGSGGGTDPEVDTVDADFDPSVLQVKFDLRIPQVLPFATYSKQDCFDYIGIPNPFAAGLICGAVPAGQGMNAWNVNNKTCPAKVANPAAVCFKPVDIIGYRIYDSYPNHNAPPVATVNAPSRLYFVADWLVCQSRFEKVSALVEEGGQILEGLPSYQVHFDPDPSCAYWLDQTPRMFHVTWDSIDFSVGDIDDGVDIEDDAEGYGYLTVKTSWSGFLQYFNLPHQEFEDEADANPYFFASLPLEQSQSKCMGWHCPASATLNNNAVDVPLYFGEVIRLSVDLMEYDPGELPEDLCIQDAFGPTLDISAPKVDQAGGTLTLSRTSKSASATCKVTFSVHSLP